MCFVQVWHHESQSSDLKEAMKPFFVRIESHFWVQTKPVGQSGVGFTVPNDVVLALVGYTLAENAPELRNLPVASRRPRAGHW